MSILRCTFVHLPHTHTHALRVEREEGERFLMEKGFFLVYGFRVLGPWLLSLVSLLYSGNGEGSVVSEAAQTLMAREQRTEQEDAGVILKSMTSGTSLLSALHLLVTLPPLVP